MTLTLGFPGFPSEVDVPFPLADIWVAPGGEVFAVGDLGVQYCVF